MVATTALFTAFFECSYGFYVRMTFESVFKAMLTTPVGVREIVLGEFLWVFIRAALMAAGVGLVLAVMGLLPNVWAIFVFPFIGGLLAVPCGAIGLLAALTSAISTSSRRSIPFLSRRFTSSPGSSFR